MKRNIMKLIIELIIIGIISIIVGTVTIKYNIISIPQEYPAILDIQLNIITIAIVFADFSFSVLGVLAILSTTEQMKKLKETSILEKSCKIISKSVFVFILVFFFAVYFSSGIYLFINNTSKLSYNSIYYLEFGYLFSGICLFLRSTYRMTYMLYYIFIDNQKNATKKVDDYKNAIDTIHKKMKNIKNYEE